MKDSIDFKQIWSQQKSDIPATDQLLKKAAKFKRKQLFQLIILNVPLITTCIFIGFIWYYYQPQLITSKIGIVLTILAMMLYLIVSNTMIPLLRKHNSTVDNQTYLQQLLKFQQKQSFLQKTMMNTYFILLSLGISLYLYEYTSRMKIQWALVTYGITLGWIGFNWFYFRPKIIKKQQIKTNNIIDKFQVVNDQLKED